MATALRDAGWATPDLTAIAMASLEGSPLRAREEAAIARALNGHGAGVTRLDYQPAVGHALAALGPIRLCLAIGRSANSRGIICNAAGYSGQAVTLAVMPRSSSVAAS